MSADRLLMDQKATETTSPVEPIITADFEVKPLTGNEPARCVDGRPSPGSEQGPQMLGGSLHPILLDAIFHDKDLDEATVAKGLKTLQNAGIKTGGHRGEHRNGEKSDCGFADRMPDILKTAIAKREMITERLVNILIANRARLNGFMPSSPKGFIDEAFDKIASWDLSRIKIKGNPLVTLLENSGSHIDSVVGDHREEVVFLNLDGDSTLDTAGLNEQGRQGFNLDIMHAIGQSATLGVSESFSTAASIILFQATELVLVEDKGKEALPVAIHL